MFLLCQVCLAIAQSLASCLCSWPSFSILCGLVWRILTLCPYTILQAMEAFALLCYVGNYHSIRPDTMYSTAHHVGSRDSLHRLVQHFPTSSCVLILAAWCVKYGSDESMAQKKKNVCSCAHYSDLLNFTAHSMCSHCAAFSSMNITRWEVGRSFHPRVTTNLPASKTVLEYSVFHEVVG